MSTALLTGLNTVTFDNLATISHIFAKVGASLRVKVFDYISIENFGIFKFRTKNVGEDTFEQKLHRFGHNFGQFLVFSAPIRMLF